jgi:hypothetical protein
VQLSYGIAVFAKQSMIHERADIQLSDPMGQSRSQRADRGEGGVMEPHFVFGFLNYLDLFKS